MRKKSLLDPRVRVPSRVMLGLIVLSAVFSLTLAQANSPNRAGLVVVHGNGEVIKQCIEFSEDEITGYEVLERSGLDLNADVTSGLGSAICRIDNEGCTYPAEDCFCQCQGSSCIFWLYWRLSNGQWKFSGLGASNLTVKNGDVQGWVWGEGSPSGGGAQPPMITFEEICASPPTATPTNTPRPPTATPTSTNTPEPTDTPAPVATPVIHHFAADRYTINAGESIVLNWDLDNAQAAYLRYDGVEEGVIAPGSKTVSPANSTVYTLVARNEGGEAIAELTITVNVAAPTSTTPPVSQQVNPQTNQAPNQQAGQPTYTPIPEPVINFSAAARTVPPGACTTLHWAVQNAGAVYLDGAEVDQQGFQEACPQQTQSYTLRVLYPGGERTAQITLEVTGTVIAPAGTLPVAATATVAVGPAGPTEPPAPATSIAQRTVPTIEARPIKRNLSPQPSSGERDGLPIWARLGIWGSLVGGWCLISTLALAGWGIVWWVTQRSIKK